MILFFDTETNGLPKNNRAPVQDLDNWPRVIQLAWACYNFMGEKLESHCYLIKPFGWTVPKEPFWINNGHSTERCLAEGIDIETALTRLCLDIEAAETMVAHNLAFDYPVLAAEMLRCGMSVKNRPAKYCTMHNTTDLVKIVSMRGGYKWPKLEELHRFLFNADFEGAHDAGSDVEATAKCYFELVKRGHVIPGAKLPEKKKVEPFNANDL